jgi:hypothetical protein
MTGLIDYAGLFPPAGLTMQPAVRNYADYLGGPDAWALGRFIVPSVRLEEFEGAAAASLPITPDAHPWLISMLGSAEPGHDAEQIFSFNEHHATPGVGRAAIDTLEVKASDSATVTRLVRSAPDQVRVFVEIPATDDPASLLAVIKDAGASAKIRTGGITTDAFPTSEQVARFLHEAAKLRVPFKATAGLHHPLPGDYRLTYEPGSAVGRMHGFLNVFIAAALALQGADLRVIRKAVEDDERIAFRIGRTGITWNDQRLEADEIVAMRESFGLSFGSCSFTEPFDDLRSLGVL